MRTEDHLDFGQVGLAFPNLLVVPFAAGPNADEPVRDQRFFNSYHSPGRDEDTNGMIAARKPGVF